MYCGKCGKIIISGNQFCNNCGAKVPEISNNEIKESNTSNEFTKPANEKQSNISRTITDIDGNIYNTVTIGTQVWMKENLNVEHFRNGNPIPQVQDENEWSNLTTGAWCYCNNHNINDKIFGKLYNWYAVNDSRGLAPDGWHIPTNTEWEKLTDYLGGNSEAGFKMKESLTTHWRSPNRADNSSGFTALPGGCRDYCGTFSLIDYGGFWWSATALGRTEAWHRYLFYDHSEAYRIVSSKNHGFSVRCLRD